MELLKTQIPNISSEEFYFLKNIILNISGISIHNDKASFLKSRIGSRLYELNITNWAEYIEVLKGQNNKKEIIKLISCISTNKTNFFRELTHFKFLEKEIERISDKKQISIWSAACSTGEEVYSIAITVQNKLDILSKNILLRILGSDIDSEVLKKAASGIYYKSEMKFDVPQNILLKYFISNKIGNKPCYKFSNSYRNSIKFIKYNIVSNIGTLAIKFDVIFLRNVLIYFSEENKDRVVKNMLSKLNLNGILIVGLSENIDCNKYPLEKIDSSVYRRIS